MILIISAVVGVLIGLLAQLWVARLIVPVAWGAAFCGFRWILARGRESPILPDVEKSGKPRLILPPWLRFYLLQFLRAVSTSFAFSVMAGFISDLVLKR
jgi:hypothetical protein